MPPPQRLWEPANEVERRMREAWSAGDADGFAELLFEAPLYLPGFETDQNGQRLLTRRRDDRTYLLVYTSVEALREALGPVTEGWRQTSFAELARSWPDPTWGLVVSPHTPIGAYLGPEQIRQMAESVDGEPAFHAADEKERAMRAAQEIGDPGVYLDLLVISQVLVPLTAPAEPGDIGQAGFPWRVGYVNGLPTISVFTSLPRLRESIAEPVPVVEVSMVSVIRAWPDPAHRLAVNPGSAMEANFTGAQVPDLLHWAQELVIREQRRHAEGGQPATAAPARPEVRRLELTVAEVEIRRYLVEGRSLVTGVVRLAGTGALDFGHLIRWYGDLEELPASRSVVELALPHGAQLVKVTAGEEAVMGSYDAELRRWNPAIADALRGFLT